MTLKIEAGKFYRTRDGRKVGPMDYNRADCHFYSGGAHYASNGECCYLGEHGRLAYPHLDIIAEWTDEPPIVLRKPAPNYASREEMVAAIQCSEPAPIDNASPLRRHAEAERPALDLTAITTPFGLLPPEAQQALRDHGGPYQIYRYDGWRAASPRTDLWTKEAVFRVSPNAAPREGYAVTLFRTAREAKTAHPGCDPIFVREVKE